MTEWIGAAEAARRLGIKEASLYSYVSRGVLTRRKTEGSRLSLFSADDVEKLARRGRPRGTPGAIELVIKTSLTEISGDKLRFRGRDALALATRIDLEDVASLLWTGELTRQDAGEWQATAEAVTAGTAACAALPPATLPLERLQVIVPALATADPLRLHLDPPAVMAAGRCLIAGMVQCLPPAAGHPAPRTLASSRSPARPTGGPPQLTHNDGAAAPSDSQRRAPGRAGEAAAPVAGGSIAERLVGRLCPQPPGRGLVDALRAALVLLADHELAASTLAARVAASVRADPYAVVATGLGAVGGALHGGASFGAEVMLRSAREPGDAVRAVGDLLRRGERIPGYGHFVYKTSDPRAVLLLDLLRRAAPDRLTVVEAVVTEARRRALPAPNIDFALAALVTAADMIPGAGEAIFAVARAVGWLAHALEEYARNTPIRPRGVYTGPIADDYGTVTG